MLFCERYEISSKIHTGFINAPKNHKITHLFEDLSDGEKTLRKLTLQKRRNGLLFLEKSFPFLGRLNGDDLSKNFGGRLLNYNRDQFHLLRCQ